MTRPTRPVLRYHGGKFRLRDWVIGHFPSHRVYIEPFGGAASVLLAKPRVYCEVYNDLDGHVCNLFRVLRDPEKAAELRRRLELTPYARKEFDASYEPWPEDDLEAARMLMVRSWMGVSSRGGTCRYKTGFRGAVSSRRTHPGVDWSRLAPTLEDVSGRLRGVLIEQRPAIDVIQQYDADDALIYCDPPYVPSTRSFRCASDNSYRHELTDDDHRALSDVLHDVEGYVLLSGYESDLYEGLYRDWPTVDRDTYGDSAQLQAAKPRTEVLWISPKTWEALQPGPLFEEAL